MTIQTLAMSAAPTALLDSYSLEMTAKDIDGLSEARALIPAATPVSVTFLPNETMADRVRATDRIIALGLTPVPHISARRLPSEQILEEYLAHLRERGVERILIVAGDLPEPSGPYADALAVIESGLPALYGIRHIAIAGYPEGHPDIGAERLWRALDEKQRAIRAQGIGCEIITQFGFDAASVDRWICDLRERGIDARVRIGVPGPANAKTLLRFAARCGVGTSAKVMAKYGLSLTRLLGTAGPEKLIGSLCERLTPSVHGDTQLHFYPFGGFRRTAEWVSDYRTRTMQPN